jgi:hypothetical protein
MSRGRGAKYLHSLIILKISNVIFWEFASSRKLLAFAAAAGNKAQWRGALSTLCRVNAATPSQIYVIRHRCPQYSHHVFDAE